MSDQVDMKSLEDGARALQAWFQSQELTPGQASAIMAMLLAKLFVNTHGKNIIMLNITIKDFKECLICEIDNEIRKMIDESSSNN